MKKHWRLAWVLLLAVVWLQAQDQHAGTNPSDKPTSAHATTFEGCLQVSHSVFTLTDKSGMAYQIQGDSSALGEHVGHEVQITGTASDSGQSRETGGTDSATQPIIYLQDVKHISKTCTSAKAKD